MCLKINCVTKIIYCYKISNTVHFIYVPILYFLIINDNKKIIKINIKMTIIYRNFDYTYFNKFI